MSHARLVRVAIDAAALLREVGGDSSGATSLFLGTVRDANEGRAVQGIEYSAYDTMAVAELARIVDEACARHPGVRVAVEHRLGTLAVGDVSVAIACSHAHRGPALDASRFVIEQLKRRVPIWKRELYTDGTRAWVDPRQAHAGAAR